MKCICSLRVSVVHAFLGVSVVDGGGETPGPFPNPEAKPARADGTAPGREWESRLPPTLQNLICCGTRHHTCCSCLGLVWSAGVPFLYARGVKIDTGVLVTCADTAPDASYRQLLHWGRISEPLRIVRWGYKARFLEGVYGWSKQQPGRLVW